MNIIIKLIGFIILLALFILSAYLSNTPFTSLIYYKPFLFVTGFTFALLLLSYRKIYTLYDYIELCRKYFIYSGIIAALLGIFFMLYGYKENITSLKNILTGSSTCLLSIIYGIVLSLIAGAMCKKDNNSQTLYK
jgi:hypothetical protein